jgi:hypothetical protein
MCTSMKGNKSVFVKRKPFLIYLNLFKSINYNSPSFSSRFWVSPDSAFVRTNIYLVRGVTITIVVSYHTFQTDYMTSLSVPPHRSGDLLLFRKVHNMTHISWAQIRLPTFYGDGLLFSPDALSRRWLTTSLHFSVRLKPDLL